jgi:regulator of protease activity HflC (stomatin/prohibitin superfamily)
MSSGLKKLAELETAIIKSKQAQVQQGKLKPDKSSGLNELTPLEKRVIKNQHAQQGASKPEKRIMWLFSQFIVHQNERGLLFKAGEFLNFLEPGTYRYFDPWQKVQVEFYDLSVPEFSHRLSDFLIKTYPESIAHYFMRIELGPQEIALIFKNGVLADLLPPSTQALYWKDLIDITTETIDISENFEIPADKARQILHTKTGVIQQRIREFIYTREVPEHQIGLLYVDGQCVKTLSPGLHSYWQINRKFNIEIWDTRLQSLEVSGQEILSKDKVSLRVNLTATYLIKDILRTLSTLSQPNEYLYKVLQFGLRAAVGTRTLDELLENKNVIDESVFAYIQENLTDLGIEVHSVGVKDIVLPGEMKTILSKVVEAEKVAQANLIKRREETAATRSLLNTAKVMEDNPTALRLKELELLEKVTENIDNFSVYGGLEGVLKELIKIKG